MFTRNLVRAAIVVFIVSTISAIYIFSNDNQPKNYLSKTDYLNSKRQIKCLADNIYYEAANQSYEGMKAVAYVTLNRATSGRWPSDTCSVVYQKTDNVCQFSWVCERNKPPVDSLWDKSYNVARHVFNQYEKEKDPTYGAVFYHATYVNPQWKYNKIIQIGDHIFYR